MASSKPYNGCSELTNPEAVMGKIALIQRGQCMFAEKARNIQNAGAIGGIVIGESSSTAAALCRLEGSRFQDFSCYFPQLCKKSVVFLLHYMAYCVGNPAPLLMISVGLISFLKVLGDRCEGG